MNQKGEEEEAVGKLDSETRLLVERLAEAEFDLETALAGSVDSVTRPPAGTRTS